MINLEITKEEASFIVESLLFSIGCDVCAEWDKNDVDKMFLLAESIKNKNNDIKIKNVYIHNPLLTDSIEFIDSFTPDIISKFPEILKEDI